MLDPLNIPRPKRTLAAPADGADMPTNIAHPANRTLASASAVATQPTPASRPTPQVNRQLSASGSAAPGDVATPAAGQRPQPSPAVPAIAPPPERRLPDTFKPTRNSGTGKFGEPTYDNASIEGMGSRPGVTTQSFGTHGEEEAGSLVNRTLTRPTYNPQVASTFGLSVNDPRMQDAGSQQPNMALRGPDAMAEAYNSREDREERKKLLSNIDSQLFMLRGKNTRSARQAIAELTGLQAQLVGGGEKLASEAIQGRAGRDAEFATTGLEQAGQDRRALQATQAAAAGALEGDADRTQQLGIARMQDATRRAELDQGETITAADGRVFRIGTDGNATAVKDAQGNQVRMPVARDAGAPSARDQLDSLGNELKAATDQLTAMQGINGTATPEQVQQQQDYVSRLQGELSERRGGGAGHGGAGVAAGNRTKPSWEQFQARAKAQGSRMTPEQLKAYYDSM